MGGKTLATILIADGDMSSREQLLSLVSPQHDVTCVASGEEALLLMRQRAFEVVCADLHMCGVGGLNVLQVAEREYPTTVGILLSGRHGLSTCRANAKQFMLLVKPFTPEQLEVAMSQALSFAKIRASIAALR